MMRKISVVLAALLAATVAVKNAPAQDKAKLDPWLPTTSIAS